MPWEALSSTPDDN
jgi:hypothetical protein